MSSDTPIQEIRRLTEKEIKKIRDEADRVFVKRVWDDLAWAVEFARRVEALTIKRLG
jgi:hypothetical protein